jgi:cation transport ATPase
VDQRQREYKYRFAQSVVFGPPVIALETWGFALGPADAARWVPLLQALLAGWVIYVNLGMLIEGLLLLLHQTPSADLLISAAAVAAYLFSLISVLHIFITGSPWYRPRLFCACVIVLIAWTGFRWLQLARRTAL